MPKEELVDRGRRFCLLCGPPVEYRQKFRGYEKGSQSYDVAACPKCGLGITRPFPDEGQTRALYSSENYREHDSRFILPIEKTVRFFRSFRRKRIEGIAKKRRILDIGCGRGVFLSNMREHGWETFGLELNEETAWNARQALGLDIKTGRLFDARFQGGFFDVITIWHVLEHMPDPALTIKECNRTMKPGGLMVIAVPNFGSMQAKLSGRYWFHLDVPYHLYHFNLENLMFLLEKYSFKIVKVRHFSLEFNPFGFVQSFLNMCRVENNFLYDLLRSGSVRKSLYARMGGVRFYLNLCVTVLLSPLFIPLSVVLSLVESLFKRGGTIEIYAVKEDI